MHAFTIIRRPNEPRNDRPACERGGYEKASVIDPGRQRHGAARGRERDEFRLDLRAAVVAPGKPAANVKAEGVAAGRRRFELQRQVEALDLLALPARTEMAPLVRR